MKIELDVPRLRKALEHVTAHPEEWEQRFWAVKYSCGSALCLAGTIVHQASLEIDWNRTSRALREDGGMIETATVLKDGRPIDSAAFELLGLERLSSAASLAYERLFASYLTLPELWRNASKLTGGEIVVPEQYREGP